MSLVILNLIHTVRVKGVRSLYCSPGFGGPRPVSLSDIGNEFLYTGRRLDPETGLYQYRHRYYHAQLGRFVTRDPIGYEGSAYNLYEYVNGMPTTNVDPNGNKGFTFWGAITGTLGAGYTACYSGLLAEQAFDRALGKWDNDKYAHCVAACRATKLCGGGGGTIGGVGFETIQALPGTGMDWDWGDVDANLEGTKCAGVESQIIPVFGHYCRAARRWLLGKPSKTCPICCAKAYPPFK